MTPAKRPARVRPAPARLVRHLFRAQSGASAVEYAILVALIAAVCVAVITALGLSVHDLFDAVHF